MLQINTHKPILHSGWIELFDQSHNCEETKYPVKLEEYCSLENAQLHFRHTLKQTKEFKVGHTLSAITSLTFGSYSLALSSAPTIFSVLNTACKYSSVLTNAIDLRLNRENKSYVEIELLTQKSNLGKSAFSDEAYQFYVTTLLGLIQFACKGKIGHVEWLNPNTNALSESAKELLSLTLECRVVPQLGTHRLRFLNTDIFDTLNQNTLDIHQAACQQLEKKISDFQITDLPRVVSRTLEKQADLSQVSVDIVARNLGMTSRTLNRKLGASNTHFRSILSHHKLSRAIQLMSTTNLSMAIIADQLGFTDSTTFSRAFKQWTGHPPSKFKRSFSLSH